MLALHFVTGQHGLLPWFFRPRVVFARYTRATLNTFGVFADGHPLRNFVTPLSMAIIVAARLPGQQMTTRLPDFFATDAANLNSLFRHCIGPFSSKVASTTARSRTMSGTSN